MSAVRLWWRRSTARRAFPVMAVVAVVMLVARSGWAYEWGAALGWASAATLLLAPLVAGLAAHDVARRLGPTLGTLAATTGRGPRAVLAVGAGPFAYGVLAWGVGLGTVAAVAGVHGASGTPSAWVAVRAPLVLLAATAVGLAVGSLVRNAAAGPLAAATVYLVPLVGRPLADGGVLSVAPASNPMLEMELNPVVATWGVLVNLAVVAVAVLVVVVRTRPVRRSAAAAALAVGASLVVATVGGLLSTTPMANAYRPAADVEQVCVGRPGPSADGERAEGDEGDQGDEGDEGTVVCGPAAAATLLEIARRDIDEARHALRAEGLETVARYRLAGRSLDPDAGVAHVATDRVRGGRLDPWDVASSLAHPAGCVGDTWDVPPDGLLELRGDMAVWVFVRLGHQEPDDDAPPATVEEAARWYAALAACDPDLA